MKSSARASATPSSDGFVRVLCRNGTALAIYEKCRDESRFCGDPSTGPILASRPTVIWFYERRGEHLRCEIQQQIEGDRFALVVTLPDGTERVEWFTDSNGLTKRSVELEKMLREKGWNGPFARDI